MFAITNVVAFTLSLQPRRNTKKLKELNSVYTALDQRNKLNMENKIISISEDEAKTNPRMCEIRFDCYVQMFEMAFKTSKARFSFGTERPQTPQWFKSFNKITLDEIKFSSEYELGARLKEMLLQMELHIKKYENNQL